MLIGSSIPSRNLGNYNPIAIGKLVARQIKGQRRIQVSRRDQIKISCNSWEDANTFLTSEILVREGYRILIPESLFYKKGFIKVKAIHSITDVENMDESMKSLIISALRRFVGPREKRQILDVVDIVFRSNFEPRLLYTYDVEHFITSSIVIPKRCYRC